MERKLDLKLALVNIQTIRDKISKNMIERKQVKKYLRFEHLWMLRLKDYEFYEDKIGIDKSKFEESSSVYKELGQLDYGWDKCKGELKWIIDEDSYLMNNKWIYLGQFKEGTEIAEGYGIMVWSHGSICEGHYVNNKRNGFGRIIYASKAYYIGETKDNINHGWGEYHYKDGKVYKGYWENGMYNGQGTLILADGTEKIGLWKDNNFIEWIIYLHRN